MVLESNRDLVLRRMVECLSRDRTKHQVAEVTSLGLIQMTRKRLGVGLAESVGDGNSSLEKQEQAQAQQQGRRRGRGGSKRQRWRERLRRRRRQRQRQRWWERRQRSSRPAPKAAPDACDHRRREDRARADRPARR